MKKLITLLLAALLLQSSIPVVLAQQPDAREPEAAAEQAGDPNRYVAPDGDCDEEETDEPQTRYVDPNMPKVTIGGIVYEDSIIQGNYWHIVGCDPDYQDVLTIPAGVSTIETDAFLLCDHITAFKVEAGSTSFSAEDGLLYSKNKATLYAIPHAKEGDVVLNEKTVLIKGSAFVGINTAGYAQAQPVQTVFFRPERAVLYLTLGRFYRIIT